MRSLKLEVVQERHSQVSAVFCLWHGPCLPELSVLFPCSPFYSQDTVECLNNISTLHPPHPVLATSRTLAKLNVASLLAEAGNELCSKILSSLRRTLSCSWGSKVYKTWNGAKFLKWVNMAWSGQLRTVTSGNSLWSRRKLIRAGCHVSTQIRFTVLVLSGCKKGRIESAFLVSSLTCLDLYVLPELGWQAGLRSCGPGSEFYG